MAKPTKQADWDRYREMDDLADRLSRLWERAHARGHPGGGGLERDQILVDIEEAEEEYLLTAELPGVRKEQASVTVEEGMLTISVERGVEHGDGRRRLRSERPHGAARRTLALPPDADGERATAQLDGGLLRVRVPRRRERAGRRIDIRPDQAAGAGATAQPPSARPARAARGERPASGAAARHVFCGEVMSRDVECVVESDSALDAASRMRVKEIGLLPVCDGRRRVVGTLTDRDVALRVAAEDRRASEVRVGDVMSREPICCRPDDDLRVAERLMAEKQKSRILVTDHEGILLGVISLADLAQLVEPEAAIRTLHEVTLRAATLH